MLCCLANKSGGERNNWQRSFLSFFYGFSNSGDLSQCGTYVFFSFNNSICCRCSKSVPVPYHCVESFRQFFIAGCLSCVFPSLWRLLSFSTVTSLLCLNQCIYSVFNTTCLHLFSEFYFFPLSALLIFKQHNGPFQESWLSVMQESNCKASITLWKNFKWQPGHFTNSFMTKNIRWDGDFSRRFDVFCGLLRKLTGP